MLSSASLRHRVYAAQQMLSTHAKQGQGFDLAEQLGSTDSTEFGLNPRYTGASTWASLSCQYEPEMVAGVGLPASRCLAAAPAAKHAVHVRGMTLLHMASTYMGYEPDQPCTVVTQGCIWGSAPRGGAQPANASKPCPTLNVKLVCTALRAPASSYKAGMTGHGLQKLACKACAVHLSADACMQDFSWQSLYHPGQSKC